MPRKNLHDNCIQILAMAGLEEGSTQKLWPIATAAGGFVAGIVEELQFLKMWRFLRDLRHCHKLDEQETSWIKKSPSAGGNKQRNNGISVRETPGGGGNPQALPGHHSVKICPTTPPLINFPSLELLEIVRCCVKSVSLSFQLSHVQYQAYTAE